MSFLPASKIVGGRQPETTNATPFLSVPKAPLQPSSIQAIVHRLRRLAMSIDT